MFHSITAFCAIQPREETPLSFTPEANLPHIDRKQLLEEDQESEVSISLSLYTPLSFNSLLISAFTLTGFRSGFRSLFANSNFTFRTMTSLFLLGTTRLQWTPKVIIIIITYSTHHFLLTQLLMGFCLSLILQNKRNWFDPLRRAKLNRVVCGGYNMFNSSSFKKVYLISCVLQPWTNVYTFFGRLYLHHFSSASLRFLCTQSISKFRLLGNWYESLYFKTVINLQMWYFF